ncbi:glycosyltransferase [Patescibacteria group bacterium]
MKVVVVIPTYNERENIKRLIPLLEKEYEHFSNHEIHTLIVDGNSPDGTGEEVEGFKEQYPNVWLLREKEKAGLGAAYVYGFRHAMKEMGAEVVVEMDADFQHDPKDLTSMLQKFDEGYDYIIGSRYIKGGSVPKEWAFYRKFLSLGGSWFSKLVLGIFNVNDFTTGFKISRVKGYLDRLDLDGINSSGFAYKIDLLYKMHRVGAKIVEVPIKFGLRDRGDSKMEKDNMMDSLRVVVLLRYEESKSFLKFLLVGLAGLIADGGVFSLLRLTSVGSSWASAISGFVGMVTTFSLNNVWSFKERKIESRKKMIKSFVVYFASSYVPIIFRSWLIDFSIGKYGEGALVEYTAFSIGILVGLVWNYTVYSRLIWKKDSK